MVIGGVAGGPRGRNWCEEHGAEERMRLRCQAEEKGAKAPPQVGASEIQGRGWRRGVDTGDEGPLATLKTPPPRPCCLKRSPNFPSIQRR